MNLIYRPLLVKYKRRIKLFIDKKEKIYLARKVLVVKKRILY